MSDEQRLAAMQPALCAMADKREGMTPEELSSLMNPALRAMADKREGMTPEELSSSMDPALRAMAEKCEANRAYYVCTIYGKAVHIDKNIQYDFKNHLGYDNNATVKVESCYYSN